MKTFHIWIIVAVVIGGAAFAAYKYKHGWLAGKTMFVPTQVG
jgi:hypothetical protein